MKDRRRFISGIVTASIVSIAGCAGSDIGDIPGDLQSDRTKPEAVVEQFTTARFNGNIQTANELLHPESPMAPIPQDEGGSSAEITISNIRQISPQKLVELNAEASGGATQEEMQNRVSSLNESIDSLLASAGGENHAFVLLTAKANEQEAQILVSVVEDSKDWLIYQFPSQIASAPNSVPPGVRLSQEQQTGEEVTAEGEKHVRIIDVYGSATNDGEINSLTPILALRRRSDPVNLENSSILISTQNSTAEISGDSSTSGLVYAGFRYEETLPAGETTLRDIDDVIAVTLDLTEIDGVTPFKPNQEATIGIEFPDSATSYREVTAPEGIDAGATYVTT